MIKLIASDIDGTLVPDGSDKINEKIYSLIKKLKEEKIYFVAASGRQFTSLIKLFEPVKDQIFFVSDNGASIQTAARPLFSYVIKEDLATKLINHLRSLNRGTVVISTPENVCIDSGDTEFINLLVNGYKNEVKVVDDITKVPNIIKISLYDKENVEQFISPLSEIWGKQLKVTLAGKEWIDFMDTDVSKGAAIALLQDALDIKVSQTCAFGDQLNDIEMLEQAKFSFAVENAKEETKKKAKYICKSHKEDGVIGVLEEISKYQTIVHEEKYQ